MDLQVSIDRTPGAPALREQLERQLLGAIRSGALRSGVALPPSRSLAAQLGISRGVVVAAYDQLAAEGFLVVRRGDRTRIAKLPDSPEESIAHPRSSWPTAPIRWDLAPSSPDLSAFPRSEWVTATNRVLRAMPDAALGYGDPRGTMELRTALADYLGRVRGVLTHPDRIVITSGSRQALSLICRVLAAQGARRVAHESPGWRLQRDAALDAGLEPIAAPVDAQGLDHSNVQADAICVTPAHQFPTGVALAPERRGVLVAWAREHAALIIEDDYDSEFRYDREPIGALQGLAPDAVAYIGTAAKTLAPGLRIAWAVLPERLAPVVAQAKSRADRGTPVIEQLVLADFIQRGGLDRHLRRTRLRYRRRRDAFVAALGEQLPEARVEGIAAGLHIVAHLEYGDERALVAALRRAGISAEGLKEHGARQDAAPALVLGYANVPEAAAPAAVADMVAVLQNGSCR